MFERIYLLIQTFLSVVHYTIGQIFGISKAPDLYRYDNESCSDLRKLPIQQTFDIVMHEKELNLWNKIAAMIDYTFPTKSKLKYESLSDEQENELKYCIKHASYAYFMDFIGDPIDIKVIKKDLSLFGIRKYKICRPGYFIGIDDKNKYILVCIRGTENLGDTLTDLDAHVASQDFGYGHDDTKYKCHHGMYDSALLIYDDITFQIQELSKKQEYSDYKMLCTGHSLGAGVCSLLGLLWNTKNIFPVSKFSCYSFASPLVIGDRGMQQSEEYGNMVSVAVSTDIVTRTSIEGLIRLQCRICELRKDGERNKILVEDIVKKRCSCGDYNEFINALDEDEKDLLDRLKNVEKKNDIRDDYKLYPCGKVLWFVPEFVVCDHGKKEEKYRKLLKMVEWQCSTPSLVHFIQLIYKLICDFYVINANEILTCLSSSGQSKSDIEIDRWEFTQMVSHGIESYHAHLPGRYLNGFDIDIFDVFAMSKMYQILYQMPMPKFIRNTTISIIMITIYSIKMFIGLLASFANI